MVTSKPTIVDLKSIFLESEADTKPPPDGKTPIKPGDWMTVLSQIAKLELDHAAMTAVTPDIFKQCISAQQDFNMLDMKVNDLKTYAKSSIIERLVTYHQN